MFTPNLEETARNHTRLLAAGLAAMHKIAEQQLAFVQTAAEQTAKIQHDLAAQATTTWLTTTTELNRLWRETVIRTAPASTAH